MKREWHGTCITKAIQFILGASTAGATMSNPVIHSGVGVVKIADVDTVAEPEGVPRLCVRSFGLTDAGRIRETNEDQFLIAALAKTLQVRQTSLPQPKVQRSADECHLFIVADGMGGHTGGEYASARAVGAVEGFLLDAVQWFARCKGKEEDRVLVDFQSALAHANAAVLAEAAEHPELRGMGTTLTLAYSLNDLLFVAHVGDSRCYLFRRAGLYRLTSDHTLVEEMLQRGALTPEEAAGHRWRHVITNAVGGKASEVKVEVHKVRLEAGDVVLLCSDGLTEMVSEEEIARIQHGVDDPEQACRALVARGNEAGGKDNITVVLARYDHFPAHG
jgi:protein phosphatase